MNNNVYVYMVYTIIQKYLTQTTLPGEQKLKILITSTTTKRNIILDIQIGKLSIIQIEF